MLKICAYSSDKIYINAENRIVSQNVQCNTERMPLLC